MQFYSFDFQGDVARCYGNALQRLVVAAAPAAHENDAGRDIGVLNLFWVLLVDVHKELPRPAETLIVHVHKGDHVIFTVFHLFGYDSSLYSR